MLGTMVLEAYPGATQLLGVAKSCSLLHNGRACCAECQI
jgi:hypothetical protein